MAVAHRHGDARKCGATTTVVGQSTTYVDGKLWAVEGDPNTHGAGALIASGLTVFIEGKKTIVHAPDGASSDSLCPTGAEHCEPKTAQGSPSATLAYGGVIPFSENSARATVVVDTILITNPRFISAKFVPSGNLSINATKV